MKKLKELLNDKPLAYGLAALLLGQVLYFFGFTTLFLVAFVYVLVVGLPYPKILRSYFARAAAAILLSFGVIQIASLVQFFAFPNSDFRILSLISMVITVGAVVGLYGYVPKEPGVWWDRKDLAAVLCGLFFVLPLAGLVYWKNDPINVMKFTGVQVPDGVNHYMAMTEMYNSQHLTYRTIEYYPKGFHISSAFYMRSLHTAQRDLSWAMNARVYMAQYILWGALLAYLLFYLSRQLLDAFIEKQKFKVPNMLLAVTLGGALGLLYLLPFAYEGFINYYFITAACVVGLMYLFGYEVGSKNSWWPLTMYLFFMVGIGMSWTILLPPLLLAPFLYMFSANENIWKTLAVFKQKAYWWVIVAVILNIIPVYLHLKYSSLTPAQGFNAVGHLRDFHYGVVLAGLAFTAFLMFGKQFSSSVKQFATNVILPFYLMDSVFMVYQLISVGEVRYYSIKIALLVEILLLALASAMIVYTCLKSGMGWLQRWMVAPLMLFAGIFVLMTLTSNPLQDLRSVVKTYRGFGPTYYASDTQIFTDLGEKGELHGTNATALHYRAEDGKFLGNTLIQNWATLMQYVPDGDAQGSMCSGQIFAILAYGSGTPEEQQKLIEQVNLCIDRAEAQHKPYFIVTDKGSVPQLQATFGDRPTYLYQ